MSTFYFQVTWEKEKDWREMYNASATKCPIKDYGLPAKVWANCLVRITTLGFFLMKAIYQQVCMGLNLLMVFKTVI